MKKPAARKRKKPNGAKQRSRPARHAMPSAQSSVAWIGELAAPYLKGYTPRAAHEDGLEGYWFKADNPEVEAKPGCRAAGSATVGFFVGYLAYATKYAFLKAEAPECIVFAWISEANRTLHERLVREQGSLMRKTFEYIRWLTHRPPRFVFHENQEAAMVRHASMKDWPAEKREHLSRNFFIETLAWLVRSGLVRKLREASVHLASPAKSS